MLLEISEVRWVGEMGLDEGEVVDYKRGEERGEPGDDEFIYVSRVNPDICRVQIVLNPGGKRALGRGWMTSAAGALAGTAMAN